MSDLLTGTTGAISLAVLGAVCFAGAAVLQHGAVSAESDRRTGGSGSGESLTLRGLRAVARQPGWLHRAGPGRQRHRCCTRWRWCWPRCRWCSRSACSPCRSRSCSPRCAPGARPTARSSAGSRSRVRRGGGRSCSPRPAPRSPAHPQPRRHARRRARRGRDRRAAGRRWAWPARAGCAASPARPRAPSRSGWSPALVRAVSQSITPGLAGLLDPAVAGAVVGHRRRGRGRRLAGPAGVRLRPARGRHRLPDRGRPDRRGDRWARCCSARAPPPRRRSGCC